MANDDVQTQEEPDANTTPASNPAPLQVVGIGASAGGLESLEQLFGELPAHPGMAFVIIQHLSPDFRSMMTELLSRHSRMPVVLARNGIEVAPDHVYLLPRRKEMTISQGHLLLTEREPTSSLALPIDVFFRSLADDVGANAVAVVLSGSGSDGSRGINDIKRAGGTVIAQQPESAKFEGMPRSAIATGAVDFVGTPREIADWLSSTSHVRAGADSDLASSEDGDPMDAIHQLLLEQFGINFTEYKPSTVGRRVTRRGELTGHGDLASYADFLRSDPEELNVLYHDLLIGVTQFFRDPEAFTAIEEVVLPQILDRVPLTEEIRVWVPGCATGEEAYSLAMLLVEQLAARKRPPSFKILATDVHSASLAKGSLGVFSSAQLANVSAARRERFFTEQSAGYQIAQELRQQIVFAPHNVTRDAPFSKMHLVSCRNMLIYLTTPTQQRVLALLHLGLLPSGFLFLGPSETTHPFSEEFEAIDDKWRIYRKRRNVRLLDPLSIPLRPKVKTSMSAQLTPIPTGDTRLLALYDRLLDRYMPAGLLVDDQQNLIDSFGGAEKYLHVKPRRPSGKVLDLLDGDLRTVVANALQRILRAEVEFHHARVRVEDDSGDGVHHLTMTAQALEGARIGRRHVLITLEQEETAHVPDNRSPADEKPATPSSSAEHEERIAMLEAELAYTRETLQAATEQQQTSNEELQATNEELIASNEELQSTNEELHSVNEELYTVNAEHQRKIGQLREVNNDIQHLLEGTDVGTLFLDADLSIRKFTPRIASVFHVRPSDIGRHIKHFAHDLLRPNLFEEIERALTDGQVVEDEVSDRHGTTFFLRILPYQQSDRTDDPDDLEGWTGSIQVQRARPTPQGVMLTLTDISALDRARLQVRQLSSIVESSEDAIISKDLEGTITTWNKGAERLYGYTAEEAIGRDIRMLAPPHLRSEIDEFLAGVKSGTHAEHVETIRIRKDGQPINVSVTISPTYDGTGAITGASAIARDITELKRSQQAIIEREARIRLLLDSTAEAIYGIDVDGVCTFCNPACVRLLGYDSVDQLVGQRMHDVIHHSHADGSHYPADDCPIYRACHTGQPVHVDDERLFRADGTSFAAEYWSHPIRQDGAVEGAVVTFLDITERKRALEQLRDVATRQEQFLAMLSHELRNPLAAILSATTLMASSGDELPENLDKPVGVIARQAGHMARLLDDLLDVSRITRGGIALRKSDIDLRVPIRAALEGAAPAVSVCSIDLQVTLPDEPLAVRGDPDRIQQIAGNLIGNAVKYSPKGSRIVVKLARDGDAACLTVTDQGDGIAPDLLPSIFELFVQGKQGRERTEGGLGVGLALVRQMAELHGGTVNARSEGAGKGSTFEVRLPLQTRPHIRSKSQPGASSTPLRIVIVEDQQDARDMLQGLLELKGHTVLVAANGEDGLSLIRDIHPDVALIDVGLPGLDGLTVAREIRDDQVFDDVFLVALTGYGTVADVHEASEAGFDQHLTKPAHLDSIEGVLAQAGLAHNRRTSA